MSSGAGRGLRPGGVVRALGRLSLLIVFGFGAGLLIGVLSEEPELLAGHLRGESETVQLAPSMRGATEGEHEVAITVDEPDTTKEARANSQSKQQLPAVAAPAAMRTTEAPAGTQRLREAPVSRTDRSQLWAIQVGAFSDERAAQKLSQALDAKGYPMRILTEGGAAGRWRVRVQPISGEAEAREVAAKLKRVERLPTWVLPMEGPSSR
jgi:cell division protein FtsN